MPEGTELTPPAADPVEADSAVLTMLQEIMGVVTNLQQAVEALAPVEPAADPEPDPAADPEPDPDPAVDPEPEKQDLEELDSMLHED